MPGTQRRSGWSTAIGFAVVLSFVLVWRAAPEPVGAGDVCGAEVGIECRTGLVRVAAPDAQTRSLELSRLIPAGVAAVVLAGRNDEELAVAAGLATSMGGPLLVLPAAGLSAALIAELDRLRPKTVVVVGSPADTDRVIGLLAGHEDVLHGARIVAAAGLDASEISASAAQLLPRHVAVAYVIGDHDILSAVTVATLVPYEPGPVLVADYAAAAGETLGALSHLAPRRLVSVRGRNGFSVEAEATMIHYASAGRLIPVDRVSAVDPNEAAVQATERFRTEASEAYLAPLADTAGLFAAAAVARHLHAPLFTTGFDLPEPVTAEISRLGAESVVVVGTDAIVGQRTQLEVSEVLGR